MLSVLTHEMDLSENRSIICIVIEQMVCDEKQQWLAEPRTLAGVSFPVHALEPNEQ